MQTDHQNWKDTLINLYRRLVSGSDGGELAQLAADAFGNTLLVADRQCHLLFEAALPQNGDPFWSAINEIGRLPAECVSRLLTSDAYGQIFEQDSPVYMESSPFGCPVLLCRLRSESLIQGFVILAQTRASFSETDPRLLQEFCGILGTRLWTIARQEEQLSFENLIKALLEGRIHGDRLRYHMVNIGLPLEQIRCLMVVQKRDSAPLDNAAVQAELESVYAGCRCIIYRARLLCLIPLVPGHIMSPDVRARFKSFLRENNIVCGCSNGFSDLSLLAEAYEQASTVLRVGIPFPDSGPILYLWEYAVYQMCDYLYGQCDLRAFCQPIIQVIRAYDQKNNTRYLETLEIYIQTGCNIQRTAARLGVHRNTADYRLDRISQLFTLDLHDPNLVYAFYLSFQILSYLERNDHE